METLLTITQYMVILSNSPETQIQKIGEITGEFNVLNPMFFSLKKSLDRQKSSYLYSYTSAVINNSIHYYYSLTKEEHKIANDQLPNFL